ncbi:MAG: FHA domain-containing protein [Deltaproteobacteria bacterium]|nr:FHA domain-containing protein [Deltaproteobacteria bacterium]
MNDDELRRALQSLGIDGSSREVIALLAVVWMAWADGKVHPEDRSIILDLATSRVHLGEEGRRVLDNWLAQAPSRPRVESAAGILIALSMKAQMRDDNDVVDLCRRLAEAAGPILGKVESPEREAIETVAQSLAVEPHAAWERLRARLVVESVASMEHGGVDDEVTNPHIVVHAPVFEAIPPADGPPGVAWMVEGGEEHRGVDPVVRIGRGRDNDLQLSHDGEVSRHHCIVERRDQKVFINDLGALNGTIVEGDRVTERRLLGGELITLGETILRYRG